VIDSRTVGATLGRLLAVAGVVAIVVGISQPAFFSVSYRGSDTSLAWFGAVLALVVVPLVIVGFVRPAADGWVFAVGALLAGYYAWLPAAIATHHWVGAGSGLWLTLFGAIAIAVGGAVAVVCMGNLRSTPTGLSTPSLLAGAGIAATFPAIFLVADSGDSYWTGPFGHSLGVVMLTVAILAALAWIVTALARRRTYGLDVLFTLLLLGLAAYEPASRAFHHFGSLQAGAWLAFAGALVAAVGTWAARG